MTKRRKLLIIGTVVANVIYILWRVCFTIPMGASRISLFLAWGLLFAEFLGIFELFVYLYGSIHLKIPQLPKIKKDLYPDVDIFIATYNEPVELLRKTILASKNLKYPKKKDLHIYLCDDGNRQEMENLAKELGVHYLKREDNKGAKAGNLNHALKHSKSPLIATFDADMIPMDHFLLETIPYFLEEHKKIGFVQTPQAFYNPDLFQSNLYSENRIPNEQDYFYRNIQMTKNHTNTVVYGGSNTVIAREALEEVGGFYENSITEDFATGILIQKKGYECYATNKPLASGLSPTDFKSLVKQRERWARGCIQTIRRLNILFSNKLTWAQKISHGAAIAYWYAPVKRFFYIVGPIAFTVFGVQVVHASFQEIMLFYLPTYALTMMTIKISGDNIRHARWTNIYETILFPSLIMSVLLETFGISKSKFSVTSKRKQKEYDKKYHYKKAIPILGLIFLSIIGMANIVIYLPRYKTLNFLVLLSWLVINLLYLIMALFFMLEFKKSNEEISYSEKVNFQLSDGKKTYRAITTEISDGSLKFEVEDLSKINVDTRWTASFQVTEQYQNKNCEFEVLIKEKVQGEYLYQYDCEIVKIDRENQDLWNGFLHNRMPTTPQTMNGSKHIWGDFMWNIRMRMN